MNVTFCAGSGRCGTVSIAAKLAPYILTRHEGKQWKRGRFQVMLPGFPQLVQQETGSDRIEWNRLAVGRRWAWLDKYQHEDYFEAAHNFSGNLELLLEKFPTMKLIHLWRPAIDVVNSFTRRVRQPVYAAEGGTHRDCPGHWRDWRDSFPVWKDTSSREESFALYWQWTNSQISAFHKRHPQVPYLILRTSEINDEKKWSEVLDFVDPPEVPEPADYQDVVRNQRDKKTRNLHPTGLMYEVVKKRCSWTP